MPDRDSALEYLSRRTRSLERRGRIRPMAPGEILDSAGKFYKLMGWTLVKHILVPTLLCYAVIAFGWTFLYPALTTTANPNDVAVQVGEVVFALGVVVLIGFPILTIAISYVAGLVTCITRDFILGKPIDERAARTSAQMNLGQLGWVLLRTTLISCVGLFAAFGLLLASSLDNSLSRASDTAAGILALIGLIGIVASFVIVPAFMSRYALVPCIVIIEGLKGKQAIRRSIELLRTVPYHGSGYVAIAQAWFLIPIAYFALFGGLYMAFSIVSLRDLVESSFGRGIIGEFVQQVTNALPVLLPLLFVIPFWCSMSTMLYFDRRTRLEGYDIETLAEDAKLASNRPLA